MEGKRPETLIGYVYNDNRKHNGKQYFFATGENIANFVMKNKNHDTVITDMMDCFVASSMKGGWLDRVAYPEFRDAIMPYLVPLQQGVKEPIDVVAAYRKEMKAERLKAIKQEMADYGIELDDEAAEEMYDREYPEAKDIDDENVLE